MGDAGFVKGFINGQLGRHNGVVGRGKHRVYAVGHQSVRRQHDLVVGGAGAFYVFDSLGIQVFLRVCDGGCGRVLPLVVEEADFVRVRVGGENQVHDCVGVQIVGGAGQVCAGGLKGRNQSGAYRVGNR